MRGAGIEHACGRREMHRNLIRKSEHKWSCGRPRNIRKDNEYSITEARRVVVN
jgi:hypothetical protein